jgi:nicotinamide riboside kinase
MANKCVVVNFIGGPGVGKSIITSEVFSRLKRDGISCDVSWEYIKRKIREKALKVIESQIYIFGKQQFQLFSMKDEVSVIVTDSPLLLNSIYDRTNCHLLKELILKEYDKYNNLLYVIERDPNIPYEIEGRHQDINGAKKVDLDVKEFLRVNNIPYKTIIGIGPNSLENIINDIKLELNK